jgi:hypothetical protein
VVIVGDCLERLTNGELLATPHRVIYSPHTPRNSIIRFNAFQPEAVVRPLPQFVTDDRPAAYSPVTMAMHMYTTMRYLAEGLGSWDPIKQRSKSAIYDYGEHCGTGAAAEERAVGKEGGGLGGGRGGGIDRFEIHAGALYANCPAAGNRRLRLWFFLALVGALENREKKAISLAAPDYNAQICLLAAILPLPDCRLPDGLTNTRGEHTSWHNRSRQQAAGCQRESQTRFFIIIWRSLLSFATAVAATATRTRSPGR